MRAPIQVRACDPSAPEDAARRVASQLLSTLPRRRPLTLAVLAQGPQAGLTPTPWVLRGVLEAAAAQGFRELTVLELGDASAAEASLRKAESAGLPESSMTRPSRDRSIKLRLDAAPRPLDVPRVLFGSSLVVVTPLLFRAGDPRRGSTLRGAMSSMSSFGASAARTWDGPLALVAEALARRCGFTGAAAGSGSAPGSSGGLARSLVGARGQSAPTQSALAVGDELIRSVFSGGGIVLDATWAGALVPGAAGPSASKTSPASMAARGLRRVSGVGPRRGRAQHELPGLSGELVSTARVLALAELGRSWEARELGEIDAWLAGALGLQRRTKGSAPEFSDSPGRWPQLAPSQQAPTRLADRAIASIRSQRGSSGRMALPARVPGPFAALWTRRWYGEGARR